MPITCPIRCWVWGEGYGIQAGREDEGVCCVARCSGKASQPRMVLLAPGTVLEARLEQQPCPVVAPTVAEVWCQLPGLCSQEGC